MKCIKNRVFSFYPMGLNSPVSRNPEVFQFPALQLSCQFVTKNIVSSRGDSLFVKSKRLVLIDVLSVVVYTASESWFRGPPIVYFQQLF